MKTNDVEILVIGAGIVGIATAYYLAVEHKRARLLIVDEGQPMALTSAPHGRLWLDERALRTALEG